MTILQGQGVSQGIERGAIFFYRRSEPSIVRETAEDAVAERARLEAARSKSVRQLEEMAEKARAEAGEAAAALFETHAMLIDDDDFLRVMTDQIESGASAEYAVRQAGDHFAGMLAAMDDAYMRARAADILDITQRIVNNLMGVSDGGIAADGPVILAADDLAPSETIQLDKSMILAIATRGGSASSHTAILSRTMGIPAVCGLGEQLSEDLHGCEAYIDGDEGRLVLDPDEETLAELEYRYQLQQEQRESMRSLVGREDVTLDGHRVMLYCNIASPEDVGAVLANDGRGIGLFRSEFLFLAADDYPTEEEQFRAYSEVARAMDGKRVIIRTLDIGADKQIGYFGLAKEENPAMGLRAVRICLTRPEIFRMQLRALYRATAYGRVAIMFPMIASVWEVEECRRMCREVMNELEAEGTPFNPETEIGIMIETPAAVLIADRLAPLVDFFSIGTNDLTQYTLACDRQCSDLGRFFDPHHPAIVRALEMTAEAAHRAGIWVGICGELAADVEMLPVFLSIGIDELSVSPSAVLPLRAAIRKSVAHPGDPAE